jgi:hypothetical protein
MVVATAAIDAAFEKAPLISRPFKGGLPDGTNPGLKPWAILLDQFMVEKLASSVKALPLTFL